MRLLAPFVILLALAACSDRAADAPAAAAKPAPAKPAGFALRIACAAAKDYTDAAGNVWLSDILARTEFKVDGGETVIRPATTKITTSDGNPTLYLNERYGEMTFHIKVPAGKYQVVLHHCETYDEINTAGERQFTVKIQGQPVLTGFDPFKEAGNKRDTAVIKRFPATVAMGTLDIEFVAQVQAPEVNAIEVIATP